MPPHFFPYRPCLTAIQHTASHTAAVQPPCHNQWYVLIGKQWYQLPEFIHSRFALAPISTLVQPAQVTRFRQPLKINNFITLDMLPFIPLHFLCTHFWQLVHCIELLLTPLPLPQTSCGHLTAFCALTLLVGRQEERLACKNWVIRCWCGYLSGARCGLFAFGPADATAIQKPHHLLPHLNPDWFYLCGTSVPWLSWKEAVKRCNSSSSSST